MLLALSLWVPQSHSDMRDAPAERLALFSKWGCDTALVLLELPVNPRSRIATRCTSITLEAN